MKQIDQYISIARQELLNPTFEITKQYLEVMEVKLKNGMSKIARIDNKYAEDTIAIYFHIKDEDFFIVISVLKEEPEWVWIESGHKIYFTASSEELTYSQLSSMVNLKPLTGWSKNDLKSYHPARHGEYRYKSSNITFNPNPNEAFELEEKLLELLIELEKDIDNIKKLTKVSTAYISICKYQYISANMGIHLDLETISRLKQLNLELDIDTYIVGTPIN